ncbi:MAG: histidine kinase [Gammaproteobacteria bacterium]|nr:histidine kinase [Gammaproteobacteria bacterium]MBU2056801.1 histidine kinase [Gammaproteobacteria bacterium]MBU2174138.1 histidine kinase [Gammaproteobacteria bacterium]MBU2246956.1 histidine kinase [Gammaproteobacteria bacterium]MBU2344073.1 histidine kinase [Gammaproteobacteria bacterium]
MSSMAKFEVDKERFWYWHLLFWLSYLLIKFIHLAVLVPLENRTVFPYLMIYALISLVNFVVTGYLGQKELALNISIQQQALRLAYWLIPLWLLLTPIRQHLMLTYALMQLETESVLRYALAFNLVLLPIAGWFALFLVYKANLLNRAQFRQQQELARQARIARLKVLRYQLNPHFMFNTLNALNSLIVQHKGLDAENLILQLSTFLRHSLKNHTEHLIPLKEELDALASYLAIQQVRFGERLQVNWQLDEQALQQKVPPLLLQPLAENAIKYAVSELKGHACIDVEVSQQSSVLVLKLSDNGPGTQLAAGWPQQASFGSLHNLAERLSLLFHGKASLSFSQQQNKFTGQISLPLELLHAAD